MSIDIRYHSLGNYGASEEILVMEYFSIVFNRLYFIYTTKAEENYVCMRKETLTKLVAKHISQ